MTVMDKMNAGTRTVFNAIFDKEPVNFMECSSLYTIIMQGRYNLGTLECMYNQASDPDLRSLIKNALDITRDTVEQAENVMKSGGGDLPEGHFIRRELHSHPLEIHKDARMADPEIVLGLAMMAKASQMALLTALHQSYQLEVANLYRKRLDAGLDHNYRIMQLMLNRGWLPYLEKVEH